MGVHLVTGYAGKEHITSADHGAYNAGTYGPGKYVLRIGSMFAAEVISNNLIKIKDGDLINQGRHINIAVNDYEECEIDNGLQSVKRNDLIVVRYTKNNETMIEAAQVLVLKGVSSATPADPKYITGDILNGAETDDFPLYRVRLNGLSIEKVEPLFSTIVSVKDILALIGSKDISKLGDGTITGGLSSLKKTTDNLNTDLGAANTAIGKKQDASTAITTGNIGQQSVNYANSAGNANTVGNYSIVDIQKDAQSRADTKQEKLIMELYTASTNGNYAIVNKSGYSLINASSIRDDSSYFVKGINKRNDERYTLIIDGLTSSASMSFWLIWAKN